MINFTPAPEATTDGLKAENTKQPCSLVSAAAGEDPIGTASAHRAYLFVEVPLPWACPVIQSAGFPDGLTDTLGAAARSERPVRLLAFAPDEAMPADGHRRLMYFEMPPMPGVRYLKKEYRVPESLVNALSGALAMGEPLDAYAGYAVAEAEAARDLFVCTHGSHDACCGKLGYPLYEEIRTRYADASNGKLRVWRTSHFGGHRLAPTLIDMPSGQYWGKLSTDVLDALLLRRGDIGVLRGCYRGWGMVGPFEQVAEREMLMREGWAWLDCEKRSSVRHIDDATARVRIAYRRPAAQGTEAAAGAYEALVRISGAVRTGGCGHDWSETKQYEASELTQTSGH